MISRIISCFLLAAACFLLQSASASAQTMSREEVNRQWTQANKLTQQEKFAEAAALFEKILPAAEAVHGKNGVNTAAFLSNMGLAYRRLHRFDKAEVSFQRSLEIREASLGKDHSSVALSLSELGVLYHNMGQEAKAETFFQRSLQIQEAKVGPDSAEVATALHHLAGLYRDMGQNAKSEALFQRCLEIREAKLGKDHTGVAAALEGMGILYRHMCQYERAEAVLQRGLQILETKYGKEHWTVARPLHSLANLYRDMGQYAKAEPFYQRSLRLSEAKHGKVHMDVAAVLNNQAALYSAMGQYAKAESIYLRSVQIHETQAGKDHLYLADVLRRVAYLYVATGQFDKAESAIRRALRIREEKSSNTNPRFATILRVQANLAWAKKDPDQAIAVIQQALEIYQARLGKDHPLTSHTLSRLAFFFSQTNRSAEAIRTMDRSLRALRIHTAQVLPILPESEQLSFMSASFAADFHHAVALGLDAKISEENRLRTAGWVLNGKSIIHQALVERLLLARDNQAPAAKRVLDELEDVRGQVARLNLRGPDKAGDAAFRKELDALRGKEKTLEGQLHGAGLANRRDPWIEMDELRTKLPKNTVYVDFLRFAPPNDADSWRLKRSYLPPIYVAWISSRDDDTAIVNLGPAQKIDAAIRAAREELQQAHSRIKQEGEIDADKVVQEKLAAVSKLVLAPLLPHLGRYPQWILGPDGNLWLIPWACLPLDGKQAVLEKHTLRYVTSGRDLVLNPLQLDHKTTPPVIFADPDFDLDPKRAGSLALPGQRSYDGRTLRQLGKVARLPGTALEADAITPALEKWAGVSATRLLDEKATVAAFQKLKSPKVLVMSTHGFFLPDQQVSQQMGNGFDAADKPASIPGLENPLLRSGLLLAGCNHQFRGQDGQETGVLTGLEIVGTDLRGTELVVLSACDTGLGEVHNGEGVAGLRQAFHLAGAQTVVASLWSIPDRETALLMKMYFEKMSAGRNKVDALRDAQLMMLRQRRERNGAGHPFYWAAFTLTGR